MKNAFFKQNRRLWSVGEAGDRLANAVGHFEVYGKGVGASDLKSYYNKANDFVDSSPYTFSEGYDTVHWDPENNIRAYTDGNGNIRSYGVETNQKKIDAYNQRVKNKKK